MRRDEIAAWVVLYEFRRSKPETISETLERNGIKHIRIDHINAFQSLLLTGAFRVAVIDALHGFPDGFGTTYGDFMKQIGNAKWPVNLTVIFGPVPLDDEWPENVVYARTTDVKAWELIDHLSQIPRPYPNFNLPENAISQSFDLPPVVADAAAQYLIYFRKFLESIGIEATTTTRSNEAGKVLFSVEPSDPTVALETIFEALSIYLKLPKYTVVDDNKPSSQNDKMNAMQLNNEIEDLKGKLRLASMFLETKDATISAKTAEVRANASELNAREAEVERLTSDLRSNAELIQYTVELSQALQHEVKNARAAFEHARTLVSRQTQELEEKEAIIATLMASLVDESDDVSQVDLANLLNELRIRVVDSKRGEAPSPPQAPLARDSEK